MPIALELLFESELKERPLEGGIGHKIVEKDSIKQRFEEMVLNCERF